MAKMENAKRVEDIMVNIRRSENIKAREEQKREYLAMLSPDSRAVWEEVTEHTERLAHLLLKSAVLNIRRDYGKFDRITAESLYPLAISVTVSALKTNYANSGNGKMLEMLIDVLQYAKDFQNGGDGADLVQETCLYLWRYADKNLTDTIKISKTHKNGGNTEDEITILRGAFRNINKLIYSHEKRQYKQVYITDYENNHGEIAVRPEWDIDTYTDIIDITERLNRLQLTQNQYAILSKRLDGKSYADIASERGVTKQAVANTLEKIGKKYIAIYGEVNLKKS